MDHPGAKSLGENFGVVCSTYSPPPPPPPPPHTHTHTHTHTQLHHQLQQSGDVGELQRRVRDLQDKLHRQKQQTRECEEALRQGGGAARKPGEAQLAVEASSQVDSKVRSLVAFTGAYYCTGQYHFYCFNKMDDGIAMTR